MSRVSPEEACLLETVLLQFGYSELDGVRRGVEMEERMDTDRTLACPKTEAVTEATRGRLGDGVTLPTGASSLLGQIDRPALLRELGGGGFGVVYLARDTVAGIEVAVAAR